MGSVRVSKGNCKSAIDRVMSVVVHDQQVICFCAPDLYSCHVRDVHVTVPSGG